MCPDMIFSYFELSVQRYCVYAIALTVFCNCNCDCCNCNCKVIMFCRTYFKSYLNRPIYVRFKIQLQPKVFLNMHQSYTAKYVRIGKVDFSEVRIQKHCDVQLPKCHVV